MDDKLEPCPFCGSINPSILEVSDKMEARDARIRAEARAEAMKEAARKIWRLDDKLPAMRRSSYQEGYGDALSDSEAAILADEPKELECSTCGRKESAPYDEGDSCYCGGKFLADEPKEECQGCFRCRNRPQPGEDRQLCDSCRLIVGQNYDPAPLADEPKLEEHELYVYDDAKPLGKEE